ENSSARNPAAAARSSTTAREAVWKGTGSTQFTPSTGSASDGETGRQGDGVITRRSGADGGQGMGTHRGEPLPTPSVPAGEERQVCLLPGWDPWVPGPPRSGGSRSGGGTTGRGLLTAWGSSLTRRSPAASSGRSRRPGRGSRPASPRGTGALPPGSGDG